MIVFDRPSLHNVSSEKKREKTGKKNSLFYAKLILEIIREIHTIVIA